MKIIRLLFFVFCLTPLASFAANSEFTMAAQLLAAAKAADIQQVQSLVNAGANVNFVDSTGVSIVCTALMNNDTRAAQILQMYGADASKCDRQIKQYNNRNKPRETGGLFSGLSSAQTISLAAAGAAVVVGGLLLLTDVFDPGNDNQSAGSGGNRPDNNPGTDTGGNINAAFVLPYGPTMKNAEQEAADYPKELDFYSPSDDSIYARNFKYMTDNYGQNYLLMMHGYSPLARGYMGMQTLRNISSREPLDLLGVNWFNSKVMGGRPVNVAMITQNGIASAGYAYDVDASDSLTDTLLPWTTSNGTTVNNADNSMVSSKYFNNKVILGAGDATQSGATTAEDAAALQHFDLAGYGTVVNNYYASDVDNQLVKIVGGRTSGYANADFMGFMPNGQMTIYRAGNGMAFVDAEDDVTGTFTKDDTGALSTINLFGQDLDVTLGNGNSFVAKNEEQDLSYVGYVGTNGLLYIGPDGAVNQAYSMNEDTGVLTLTQQLQQSDYFNYKGLRHAANLWAVGDLDGGRSKPDVLSNAFVVDGLRAKTVETIEDVLSVGDVDRRQAAISGLVNSYYDAVDDSYYPGADATYLFGNLGSGFAPLVIFSTGAFETDSSYSGRTLSATFENAVPLAYENSEHYFMSVVGVGLTGSGTAGVKSVTGYAPSGKIALAQWNDTDTDKYYKARVCGIAGTGAGDVDPWCFAAAGVTDEMAVSAAAGATGAVKSAFPYLSNPQIFALLALTADGPYLGTGADGKAITKESLAAYLQSMYMLPNEYQYMVDNGADYLDTFANVFGYGLINLERATKPGTAVYYYNGNDIVSADGNAYWRAASNTVFRPSAVFNLSGETISAPFFDTLTSVDGDLSVPRVWQNEFTMGTNGRHALYMGDVLGDLSIGTDNVTKMKVGDLGFAMSVSGRPYDDNMGGVDSIRLDYAVGNWNFAASYQRYLTDGVSRFSGAANPVLGIASNVLVSDIDYKFGEWSVGVRAFSGAITDEGLLENDPTISSQYMPAKLGLMRGGQSHIAWESDAFKLKTAFGVAYESDTLLGAYTDGLLNLGAGSTTYVDIVSQYRIIDDVNLMLHATFAKTANDMMGGHVLGLSDIYSNAFAVGANVGKFEFVASMPLAVTDAALKYAYAKYGVSETADNNYVLNIIDTHVEDLSLAASKREFRYSGTYRHNFGSFTDGAFGFIYRVNPNHTDEFGNESIFMMKISHRLGI